MAPDHDRTLVYLQPLVKQRFLLKNGITWFWNPVGNRADVGAGVDLEAVCNSVVVEDGVQLDRIEAQTVLVAHVHRDGAILLEVADVLIHKGQRCVRRVFRDNLWLRNAVLGRQIEVERGILRIWGPCRRCCILGCTEAG